MILKKKKTKTICYSPASRVEVERSLNKLIYLHDQLAGKLISFINSENMRKASTFTVLFSSKLFCFCRLLCALVLPSEYLEFKENESSIKKALVLYDINWFLQLLWLRVLKIPLLPVLLMYPSNLFMPIYLWNCTQISYPVNKICCKNKTL